MMKLMNFKKEAKLLLAMDGLIHSQFFSESGESIGTVFLTCDRGQKMVWRTA